MRTSADDVNPQASPTARGVAGIGVKKGDQIIWGTVIPSTAVENTVVCVISEKGYVKRVSLPEYSKQGRGTQGVQTLGITTATGKIGAMAAGAEGKDLDVIFENGRRQRIPWKKVPADNRRNRGKRLVKVRQAEAPVSKAVIL